MRVIKFELVRVTEVNNPRTFEKMRMRKEENARLQLANLLQCLRTDLVWNYELDVLDGYHSDSFEYNGIGT